jgi:hypothetical protein
MPITTTRLLASAFSMLISAAIRSPIKLFRKGEK